MKNSVQTGNLQIRVGHQSRPHWNNPRRSYCCGSSAPARCPNWAWTPVGEWVWISGLKKKQKKKHEQYITVSCFLVNEAEVHLIWVLTGDPCSYDVASRTRDAIWRLKVNNGVTPGTFSIKHTYVLNSVKWDAHRNLWEIKQIFRWENLISICRINKNKFLILFLGYNYVSEPPNRGLPEVEQLASLHLRSSLYKDVPPAGEDSAPENGNFHLQSRDIPQYLHSHSLRSWPVAQHTRPQRK